MKGIYNQQWQGPTTDFVVRLEKTNLEGSVYQVFYAYSFKNWKAGFSRSSSAAFMSEKSFSCSDVERSSTEKGML